MKRFGAIAFGLLLALAGVWPTLANAQQQVCTLALPGVTLPSCGDANRGKILYGQVPTPAVPQTWNCNQCHSASPLTDTHTRGAGTPSDPFVPVLLRASPRDPAYMRLMMGSQPEVAPIIAVITDTDLGDLAEFLYTCKLNIAPCGTGGPPPPPPPSGQLQGPSATAFGDQGVGSTSAPAMLTLVNIGGGTVTVSNVATNNPAEFPIVGNTCTVLTQATSCNISFTFRPSALGPRSATVTVTSNGLGNPQVFSLTGNGAVANNYEGLWWNPSEDGWGINFEHQGNTIFATWFTYDTTGKAWWLVMTADAGPGNTFTGTLYKTTGSPYSATTFTAGTPDPVGTGTLTFTDTSNATFTYNVDTTVQTKAITRQVFGPLPTCTYGASPNLAGATNYQGLWWNASESGWGINFTHQGTTIFATWFTFDVDGSPLWLVATMPKGTGESFAGTMYRMTATPFNAVPFAGNAPVNVGSATLTFANGNSATFSYTIGTISRAKQLTRQLFAPPAATLCQ